MTRFVKKTRPSKNLSIKETLFAQWEKDLPKILQLYKGIIVASSGGLDSTVLFHLLCTFTKEKINFSLRICHINFNLRSNESLADEKFVQKLAHDSHVPLLLHQAPKAPHGNIQEWARNVRQTIFADYIAEGWLIALGHHKDDLAESTLMRLCRGKSLAHIGGMSSLHRSFFRPFLLISKASLREYADKNKMIWCEDSSNSKLIYKRNIVRNQILPALCQLYPSAPEHLARAAWEAKELSQFVGEILRPTLESYGDKIPAKFLLSLPKAVAMTVLASFIGPKKKGRKELNSYFLEAVLTHLANGQNAAWTAKVPASDLLLCLKDGAFTLEVQAEVSSKGRQHEISLKQRNLAAFLQDKDYFQTYRLPGPQASFDVGFTKKASGKVILSSLESQKTYSFGSKRLKSKELYNLFQIPAPKRAELLLVSTSELKSGQQELAIGLILGKRKLDP